MRDRLPGLVAIALLVLLVAGTWWAADYTQRAILVDPPRRITHEPDAWARHFVMLRSDPQGLAVNRLEGDWMQHFPDDDSYEITRVRAAGRQPDAPVVTGTADMAVMDQDSTRIVMRGNAHVHRAADAERPDMDIRSDTLTMLTDQDVVLTEDPAVVTHGQSVMKGHGMRYDNKARLLQVHASTDVKISGSDRNSSPPSPPDTAKPTP